MTAASPRFVAIATIAASSTTVSVQSYPTSPITLVAHIRPARRPNSAARQLQTPISRSLGQTVIIENKGEAGGVSARIS